MSRSALYTYWRIGCFFFFSRLPARAVRDKWRSKRRDLRCSPLFPSNGLWSNESKWQVTRRALAKGNNVAPRSSLSPLVRTRNDSTRLGAVCAAPTKSHSGPTLFNKENTSDKLHPLPPPPPPGLCAARWLFVWAYCFSIYYYSFAHILWWLLRTPGGRIQCTDGRGCKLDPTAFMCKMKRLIITRPSLR